MSYQHHAVLAVLQYIDNHFTEDIRLDALASIAYARKLLANSNFSVTQIAFEEGFSSISNFHKKFGKLVEVSPKEYQAQYFQW